MILHIKTMNSLYNLHNDIMQYLQVILLCVNIYHINIYKWRFKKWMRKQQPNV